MGTKLIFLYFFKCINSCSGINAFKEIQNRDFFNNVYEYDTFGMSRQTGYTGIHDQYYANVFNTEKSGLEKLSAISTYCNYPNSYIKLYVSTDGGQTFSEKTADSGYTKDAGGKGYKIDDAGYYTFILDNPVELNCNKFVVAIEVQQAENDILIPLENTGSAALSSKAVVENGSYIGSSIDHLKSNITSATNNDYNTCIKAFTEDITADKTTLTSAIADANTNKTTTVVSTNGTDVYPANKWVTSTVMTAYTDAIAAAQAVADNASATQAQVDTAVSDLAAATTTFNNAKQAGIKVTAANTNKTIATISADGTDVDPASKWVTQSVNDAYAAAISTAQEVASNSSATQTDVDNAVSALAAATTTFNNAKAAGTKVTAADKTALQSLYNVNKDKTQGNYTTATWTTFATALNNANTVLANATQLEVNTALTSFDSAINGLITKSSGSSGGSGGSGSSGGSSGSSGSGSSKISSSSSSSSSSSTTTTSSSSKATADTVKSIITSNGTAAATKDSIAKAIATIGVNNTVDETVAKEIVKEAAKVVTENIVTNLKAVVDGSVIASEAKEIANTDGNTIEVTTVTKDGKSEGTVITSSANSTTATVPINTAAEVTAVYKYVPLLGKYMQLTDGVQITAGAVTLPTQANVVYYAATTPLASTETVTQGWAKVDINWYMVNKTGDVQTGWQKDSTGWVYLSLNNGVMQTGWNKQGETWYHLGSNGYMSTGWVKDNNTWYYLNSDGSMAHDTKINGYYLSTSGAWVR